MPIGLFPKGQMVGYQEVRSLSEMTSESAAQQPPAPI